MTIPECEIDDKNVIFKWCMEEIIMDNKFKDIVNEAYMACINGVATYEQKLIWELANAVHCTRVRWMVDDIETARKILYENDYFH